MKKITTFLLVILHLGLWSVFILNQFGVGPAWAEIKEKEKAALIQIDKEVKKSTETAAEVKKSTAAETSKTPKMEKTEQKRPKGISDEEWEKMKAKKVLPYDKGPSIIDISKYPKEMQDIYKKDFTKKCSKCHTVARAINAPYALPGEWRIYIKKMMKKPGSGINPMAAKKIYKFLVYDSSIRKKDIIERKLKEKAENEKKKATKKKK